MWFSHPKESHLHKSIVHKSIGLSLTSTKHALCNPKITNNTLSFFDNSHNNKKKCKHCLNILKKANVLHALRKQQRRKKGVSPMV